MYIAMAVSVGIGIGLSLIKYDVYVVAGPARNPYGSDIVPVFNIVERFSAA